jgi:hypothetical protein
VGTWSLLQLKATMLASLYCSVLGSRGDLAAHRLTCWGGGSRRPAGPSRSCREPAGGPVGSSLHCRGTPSSGHSLHQTCEGWLVYRGSLPWISHHTWHGGGRHGPGVKEAASIRFDDTVAAALEDWHAEEAEITVSNAALVAAAALRAGGAQGTAYSHGQPQHLARRESGCLAAQPSTVRLPALPQTSPTGNPLPQPGPRYQVLVMVYTFKNYF